MRTYYVFLVNEVFYNFYRKKPYFLYKIFEEVYRNSNLVFSYKLLMQVSHTFDTLYIDKYVDSVYCNDLSYFRNRNKYMINNLYSDEISTMFIHKTHLRIKSNIDYPVFLNLIRNVDEKVFLCDFVNKDYFFINKLLA